MVLGSRLESAGSFFAPPTADPVSILTVVPSVAISTKTYDYVPLSQMNMRKDWFEAFKTSVKREVQQPRIHLIDDLFASVPREQAIDAIKKQHKGQELIEIEKGRVSFVAL